MIPSMRMHARFKWTKDPPEITKYYPAKFIINSLFTIELYYMSQSVLNERAVI